MRRFSFVTAPRNVGKTAYLRKLSAEGGFHGYLTLSPDSSKQSLYLLNLDTGAELPLMHRDESGCYVSNEETFRLANEYLCSLDEGRVILDECGRIELSKGGFYPALEHFLTTPELQVTIAVRDTNLERLISLLGLGSDEYEVITLPVQS